MNRLGNFIGRYISDNNTYKLDYRPTDLVCSHIYQLYSEKSLVFMNPVLLKFMDTLANFIYDDEYLLINNYLPNPDPLLNTVDIPKSEERGLRCNLCRSIYTGTVDSQCMLDQHMVGNCIDINMYVITQSEGKVTGIKELDKLTLKRRLTLLEAELPIKIHDLDTPFIRLSVKSDIISPVIDYAEPALSDQVLIYDEEELEEPSDPTPVVMPSATEIDGIDWLMGKTEGGDPVKGMKTTRNPGCERIQMIEGIQSIANSIGCHPNYLMAVIMAESGGNSNAAYKASNPTRIIAYGLIQFTNVGVANLRRPNGSKLKLSDITKMTAYQQLEYVQQYFSRCFSRRQYQHPWDVYLAVFAPAFIGSTLDTIVYRSPSKAYQYNKGLDLDNKGFITVNDLWVRIKKKARAYGIKTE